MKRKNILPISLYCAKQDKTQQNKYNCMKTPKNNLVAFILMLLYATNFVNAQGTYKM